MSVTKSTIKRLEKKASIRFGSELVVIVADSFAEEQVLMEEATKQGKTPIWMPSELYEKFGFKLWQP